MNNIMVLIKILKCNINENLKFIDKNSLELNVR